MGQMDTQQMVQLLMLLISAGLTTEQQIAAALRARGGEVLTDDQLNAVIDGVMADAERRKALAEADLTKAQQDGAQ